MRFKDGSHFAFMRSYAFVRSILVVIGGVLVPCRLHAQPTPRIADVDSATVARIDSLFSQYDRPDAPGYAIGIVQKDRLVYGRGFGIANLDYEIPITPSSVFNVASLSKQFTAACIGILIRQGRLSLEDEVKLHLPQFPDFPGPIRVKHLVYMTSGLPEYFTLKRPAGRSWDLDYFTVDEAIATVLRQPRLRFAPGTEWAYSNINYMLLAEIVERVSGGSFAEFARREIFEPLGMVSSHFNDDLGIVVPNRVTGYNVRESGEYQQEIRRSPHFGGSGLFTTVEDLVRWDRSFETHALGGPELTALVLSTMKFEHDKANDAFGLVWGSYRGLRTIWYEGGDVGFSSYMVRLPDERLTVIVLSNLGTGRAGDHAGQILDVLLDGE
ncbi:MAG: serine hydrolase domain-containing protein [Longimicrobiales bacterium]